MVDGVSAMMSVFHTSFARGEFSENRASNMLDGGAPYYRCYKTLDEKDISVGPIEPKFFAEFVRLAELPENFLREQNIKINEVVQPAPAPRFGRTPAGYPNAPVGSGANNKEILSEIGFSNKDIDKISSEIN